MYKELTYESLAEVVAREGESKKFELYTGYHGHSIFEKALQKEQLKLSLNIIFTNEGLTEQEHNNLLNMINSPDEENYEIAKVIINQKAKTWQ